MISHLVSAVRHSNTITFSLFIFVTTNPRLFLWRIIFKWLRLVWLAFYELFHELLKQSNLYGGFTNEKLNPDILYLRGSNICWNGVRVDRMLTPDSCDDSGDEPTLLWFNFMQHSMLWLLKGCNITINCCLCWRFKLKMIFGSNIIQTLSTLRYRITCDMCQQGIIEALILNCTTNTIHYHKII